MSMIFKDIVGIIDNTRKFNSVQEWGPDDSRNWTFKYTTQNLVGGDITFDGGVPDTDKSHYPEGTIFFDSDNYQLYVESYAEKVIIDNTPPKLKKTKIAHFTTGEDHKCEFLIESDTPIDICQLSITGAGLTLYDVNRKTATIEQSSFIDNITLYKNGDEYTLRFTLKNDLIDYLNNDPLKITLYDIAGNSCIINDSGKWTSIQLSSEVTDLEHLIISFEELNTDDKIIKDNIDNRVIVTIFNPNKELWSIQPTFELTNDSVGVIDTSTIKYYDDTAPEIDKRGHLIFRVNNITETGMVIVHAWIDVDNPEIASIVYNATEATGECGPWIATEGRKYNLKKYVPNFAVDEHFHEYISFVELFLNTCFTSLDSTKRISILEKIARINNFNDVQAIERKLINQFKVTHNIEVDPSLYDLKTYLERKTVPIKTEITEIISEDGSNTESNENGVNVSNNEATATTKTTIKIENKNAYDSSLSLDDITDIMRYVYKTIPYYNQIKGTISGIKMILNTLGLCVKLVSVWSEHKTLSNIKNNNITRRADEINATIEDYDYDSTYVDIGKYFLTSMFDVDVLQSDLTFKEFNDIADNIIKVIFQIKPVTRTLRKLSYVLNIEQNLYLNYFNLTNNNRQEYHCFNYIWNLFDKYSMSKSSHDVYSRSCNNLFVPFNAQYAKVTYKNPNDTAWKEPRATFTNTYHNLNNIEHKFDVSNISVLHVKFAYIEKVTKTTVTKNDINIRIDIDDPIYYVNGESAGTMSNIYELVENSNIKFDLNIPNDINVTSETNGFNIELKRAATAILQKTNYNGDMLDEPWDVITVENNEKITKKHEPIGLLMQLKIAIPLGTKFITQWYGDINEPVILNPEDSVIPDEPIEPEESVNPD